jgi:GT2 family glycosyltransferase
LLRHLADETVGLVGPVTNWAGNEARIEVPYVAIEDMDDFAAEYVAERPGEAFDIAMLALFCTAFRRDIVERVGILDERFGIGMFEDDDFSKRVRNAWYRVVCAEDVFVHHWGRASFKELDAEDYDTLFHQNRQKFEEKWEEQWNPHQARQ